MTTVEQASSPSTPSKSSSTTANKIEFFNNVASNNSGPKNDINNQQNEKVLAATNALSDLFVDDNEEEEEEKSDIEISSVKKTINKLENNKVNGNSPEVTLTKAKKNSPVDLYGCDEMGPVTLEQPGNESVVRAITSPAKNSNTTTTQSNPSPKFQLSNHSSNDTSQTSSSIAPDNSVNKRATKSNSTAYTASSSCNDNTSQSIYSSFSNSSQANSTNGLNINENILSQIISNTNNCQQQQSNYSNVNYLMRRERSLDRTPTTESFIENLLLSPAANMRRSYASNNSNQLPQNNGNYSNQGNQFNSNSQLSKSMRQSNQQQLPHQHHHRSNSILNTNSITSANPLTNLNNPSFNRDYGNGIIPSNGLRSSARALSSTSFSTQNFQRDPSATSLKSLGITGGHGSNGNLNCEYNTVGTPVNNGGSTKLNFIKDLQIKLMDMQKECYYLRCELDSSQQKLTSSMQSIKQFWSPELKRERQQRKEESGKYSVLLEQYKILQNQYQTACENYEQQSVLYTQLQLQVEQYQNSGIVFDTTAIIQPNKQMQKEKSLLKKTINELEMRITTQKQSLTTKDETIKKLFHLVKSASNKIKNNDIYATVNEAAQQMSDIDALTTQLEASNSTNMLISERLQEEERKSEQLKQCVQQYENQVKLLQDELNSAKNLMQRSMHSLSNENYDTSSGIHSSHTSPQHSSKQQSTPAVMTNSMHSSTQIDSMRANEKQMKEKLETIKSELLRKETELQLLKTKFETCESKEKDLQHYLNLLKESISTKDQQITMQQSEINDLRTRSREKEAFIEKKNVHLQAIQLEKHQRDSDIGELRDQMDIKERKINVLNRKIENLEEQLKDKEMQISTIRSKLSTGSIGSGTMHHVNLIKTIEQKEKIIEKLTKDAVNASQVYEKQYQNQSRDAEMLEQIESLNSTIRELNEKVEAKNKEAQDTQNDMYDLKDELEMLKTQLLRKDSHVNSLELSLTQKNEEIELIEEKLERISTQQQQQMTLAANTASQQINSDQAEIETLKKQIAHLQKEIATKDAHFQNRTDELNSLKEIIDEFESQKKLVRSKLEQQQAQFAQLTEKFETTTNDFESQLREEREVNDKLKDHFETTAVDFEARLKEEKDINDQLKQFLEEKTKAALKDQEDKFLEKLEACETEIKNLKRTENMEVTTNQVTQDVVAPVDCELVLSLRQEIEDGKQALGAKDEQIQQLTDRIGQLEEALRESVSITAEREFVVGQQKMKAENFEEENQILQEKIQTMQKSLYEQQCEFNRYQEELYKREEHLQKLEEEKVEEMNQLLVTKQELLLSTISEKDALIGSLECDKTYESRESQSRIQQLNDEKDDLHRQLKDLNEKRMKLMQDHMHSKEAKDKVKSFTLNTNSAHDVDGITG